MRRGGEMNTICSSFPGELSTRAGACWANPAARQGHRTPEGRARNRAPEHISMKPRPRVQGGAEPNQGPAAGHPGCQGLRDAGTRRGRAPPG